MPVQPRRKLTNGCRVRCRANNLRAGLSSPGFHGDRRKLQRVDIHWPTSSDSGDLHRQRQFALQGYRRAPALMKILQHQLVQVFLLHERP